MSRLPFDDNPEDLPESLQADLAGLFGPGPAVPPAVDRRILGRAESKLAGRRRVRWLLRGAGIAAAAACVVFLLRAGVERPLSAPVAVSPPATIPSALAGDMNDDGGVNIIDALLLARALDANAPLPPELDLDHDGKIDRNDVDRLAAVAVKLDEGGIQ